jgi:hypothetical protein
MEQQQVACGALNSLSWAVSHHAANDSEHSILVLNFFLFNSRAGMRQSLKTDVKSV